MQYGGLRNKLNCRQSSVCNSRKKLQFILKYFSFSAAASNMAYSVLLNQEESVRYYRTHNAIKRHQAIQDIKIDKQ